MKTLTVYTPDENVKISAVLPFDENTPTETEKQYKHMLLGLAHLLNGAIKNNEMVKLMILQMKVSQIMLDNEL